MKRFNHIASLLLASGISMVSFFSCMLVQESDPSDIGTPTVSIESVVISNDLTSATVSLASSTSYAKEMGVSYGTTSAMGSRSACTPGTSAAVTIPIRGLWKMDLYVQAYLSNGRGNTVSSAVQKVSIPALPVTSLTISNEESFLGVGDHLYLNVDVQPSDASDKTITWTSSNNAVASVDANGTVTGLTSGEADIVAKANGSNNGSVTTSCKVTVFSDYVDLGLSVKWASCNLGATTPVENGNYYAWGETVPKSTFSWSNYAHCSGTQSSMTKYCMSSSFGKADYLSVLLPADDAATANRGTAWRMPSSEEVNELIQNCNCEEVKYNGTSCYRLTSKKSGYTKASIIFPVAGYKAASTNTSEARYWTGDLDQSSSNDAMYFSPNQSATRLYRYYGLPVRPVYDSSRAVPVTAITIDQNALSLIIGYSAQLKATVFPDVASDKTVRWSSSNNSVATVDSNGNVTAISVGTATITVTSKSNGSVQANCTVTVTRHPLTDLFGEYTMQTVTNSSSGYIIATWTMNISAYEGNAYRCWLSNINYFCSAYASYLDGSCKVYAEVSKDLKTITIPVPQTIETTGKNAFSDTNNFVYYYFNGKNTSGTISTDSGEIVFTLQDDGSYITTDSYSMSNAADVATYSGKFYWYYMTAFSQFNPTSYPTLFHKGDNTSLPVLIPVTGEY